MKQSNKTTYRILSSIIVGLLLACTPIWVYSSSTSQAAQTEEHEAEANLTEVKLPNPIFLFLNGMR